MKEWSLPEPLHSSHECIGFECGVAPLDLYLTRHALSDQASGASRTFVALVNRTVVGYYSLAASSIEHEVVPDRVARGLARHPIPILILARLAVHREWQGRGIAKGLFVDCLRRSCTVADHAGVRALVVDAKDAEVANFYSYFGMNPLPEDPLRLILLMKDVRSFLRNAG